MEANDNTRLLFSMQGAVLMFVGGAILAFKANELIRLAAKRRITLPAAPYLRVIGVCLLIPGAGLLIWLFPRLLAAAG